MTTGKPVTVTLKKGSYAPLFKEWEIIKSNNHPAFGKESWSIVTKSERSDDNITLSMRRLNVSKWKWVRYFELKIIKKLFKEIL